MKWSEQMRELLSEDEHYNQLMCDVDTYTLYLNNKSIASLQPYSIKSGVTIHALLYDDFKEIIKKYPFFTDIKFLLNCIFKNKIVDGIEYYKAVKISYQKYTNDTWLLIGTNKDLFGIQIDLKENTVSPA